jgi:indole-3-acetate monooxygenase
MNDGSGYIQRARELAPLLGEAGDEIERRRELPEHVVAALIDGGFFRMLQPHFLGGAELRPVLFTQVTEALAETNASVAWCVGQNNGCSMTAAYLDREVACEMFGPPTTLRLFVFAMSLSI